MNFFFHTLIFQGPIYTWVRDHRVHHKFMDTDADPHNARRGLFFSHVGWLLIRKHPEVVNKGAMIDCSDLEQDPFVVFQRKYVERNFCAKMRASYKLSLFVDVTNIVYYIYILLFIQVVCIFGDSLLLCCANLDTLFGVERDCVVRVASYHLRAMFKSQWDLFGKFRGS